MLGHGNSTVSRALSGKFHTSDCSMIRGHEIEPQICHFVNVMGYDVVEYSAYSIQ